MKGHCCTNHPVSIHILAAYNLQPVHFTAMSPSICQKGTQILDTYKLHVNSKHTRCFSKPLIYCAQDFQRTPDGCKADNCSGVEARTKCQSQTGICPQPRCGSQPLYLVLPGHQDRPGSQKSDPADHLRSNPARVSASKLPAQKKFPSSSQFPNRYRQPYTSEILPDALSFPFHTLKFH